MAYAFTDQEQISLCFNYFVLLQVKIQKAERDVYAATIDDKVAVKIGPGHFEPPSVSGGWSLVIEGNDYKVWEVSK